jgi:hypothetical protein
MNSGDRPSSFANNQDARGKRSKTFRFSDNIHLLTNDLESSKISFESSALERVFGRYGVIQLQSLTLLARLRLV